MTWINVIQWILLAGLVITLAVISAPIRFGITAAYEKFEGKRRKIGGEFWVSYIHPALFLYRYSSRGHRERVIFFGFDRKKKKERQRGDTNTHADTTVHTDAAVHTDTAAHGDSDIGIDTDSRQYENARARADDDDDGGGEPLWARAAERVKHVADERHIAGAIDDIRAIGSSGTYRFLKDKILRRKILRWLRRSAKHAVGSVRLDRLKVWTRIGFANPVRAGKTYGYFIAARNALELRSRAVDLDMEPVFMEKRLELDTEFAGRTSIAMSVSGFLAIALTFPYWRVHKLRKQIKKEEGD